MSPHQEALSNEDTAIALDPKQLLGYWLLPEERIEHRSADNLASNLKMGTKGGNKFFGGNAGIRRVKA